MSIEVWSEKYRPQTLDEYVWRDPTMRRKFETWLEQGVLPDLILSGRAGTGKTSLVKLLLKLLGVPEGDILTIKASRERQVDKIEARITGFVQTYPMMENEHGIKYVFLDEADSMSHLSQKFLRSEMDHYKATTRFIFTLNYINRMEPAIISRCQHFHFEALSQDEFLVRVADVLAAEKVTYEPEHLVEYIGMTYPDLRKCIGVLDQNTIRGVLQPKPRADEANRDYLIDAIAMFKSRRFGEARKLIISQTVADEYPDVFRWLYQNLELWGSEEQQDEALIVIRDGLYKHSFVADAEINLSATISQLAQLLRV